MLPMADNMEKARELWKKYYMLTGELLKFINKEDIDTFVELVDQRQKLLDMAEALPDTEYRATAECKELFAKIKPVDMQIIFKAKSWLNKSKRNTMTVKSYDIAGSSPVGKMLNRQL